MKEPIPKLDTFEDPPYTPSAFEERVGGQYDALLRERDRLMAELDVLDIKEILAQKISISDEEWGKIVAAWWSRMKEGKHKSSFFASLIEMGIDPFVRNMEKQEYPVHLTKISFDARKELEDDKKKHNRAKLAGGIAYRDKDQIAILEPQQTLQQRLYHFATTGTLTSDSQILVHELVHRYHLNRNPATDAVLTEAHAYLSGIYTSPSARQGTAVSKYQIAETLVNDKGLYKYNPDEVNRALQMIELLYALGKDDEKIGELVLSAQPGDAGKRGSPLWLTCERLKMKQGVEVETVDGGALQDLFRLHVNNERMKAQICLAEFLKEEIEATVEMQDRARRNLCEMDGKSADYPFHNFLVAQPADGEFYYDSDQNYRGIFFGSYVKDGEVRGEIGVTMMDKGKMRTEVYDEGETKMNLEFRLENVGERLSFETKCDVWKRFGMQLTGRAFWLRSLIRPGDVVRILYEVYNGHADRLLRTLNKYYVYSEQGGIVTREVQDAVIAAVGDMARERAMLQKYTPRDLPKMGVLKDPHIANMLRKLNI